VRLEWTAAALKDRDRIFDYTEEFNPAAAIQVDQRISDCVARLEEHPPCGHQSPPRALTAKKE
jgi:toxin ParE1/3/4